MSGLDLREKLAKAIHDTDCDPDFVDLYETADPEPRQYAQNAADAAMKVFAETVGHNEGVHPQVLRNLADLYGDVIGTLMAAHLRRAAARLELLDFIASTLKDQSHE